jgi:hypothetical protein
MEGFRVLPETWQRYADLESLNETIERTLAQCKLFVQLLSSEPGEKPFDQSQTYPWLQHTHAVKAKKTILQWRDPKLEMNIQMDTEQRALLEGYTVRAIGLEEFKRAVVEAATPKVVPSPPSQGGKFVYVYADPRDQTRAEELVESPYWDNQIGYVLSLALNDPAAVRQYMEINLLHCDAALLIYCGSGPDSVLSQLMQCQKILAQREPPFPVIAIYDGPPPPQEKASIKLRLPNLNLRTLNCREDQNELAEFLKTL